MRLSGLVCPTWEVRRNEDPHPDRPRRPSRMPRRSEDSSTNAKKQGGNHHHHHPKWKRGEATPAQTTGDAAFFRWCCLPLTLWAVLLFGSVLFPTSSLLDGATFPSSLPPSLVLLGGAAATFSPSWLRCIPPWAVWPSLLFFRVALPPSSSFNVCVHSEMMLWMWKGPLGGGAAVPLPPSEQFFSGWQGKSKRNSINKEVKSVSEVKCCQVKWWSLLLLWVVLFPAQSPLWRCCFPMFLILRGAGFAVTDYFFMCDVNVSVFQPKV